MDINELEKEFKYIIDLIKYEQQFENDLFINLKLDRDKNYELISINDVHENSHEGIQIRMKFFKNRIEIPLIYLTNTGIGTGTKIVSWFLAYAQAHGYQKLIFKNIEPDNIKARAFYKKFDGAFEPSDDLDKGYSDYVIGVSENIPR